MSQISDFYFPSSSGLCQIHARQWLPDEEPYVGIVQIMHGMAEHIARYDAFARFLNEHGYVVVGNDHLGHGTSVVSEDYRGHFTDRNGWAHVSNDTRTLQIMTARNFPHLPYFIFGHSMGSFLARTYLIRFAGTVDGAVICGTGHTSPKLLRAAQLVAKEEAMRIGVRARSKILPQLCMGSYNKQFAPNRTPSDWLSLNEENVDRYCADPLCGGEMTVGFFRDLINGLHFIGTTKNLDFMKKDTPVFLIAGAEDPVGNNGKGVQQVYDNFIKAGMADVSLHLYPGLRHEILNEACNDIVYNDILTWLESKRTAAP